MKTSYIALAVFAPFALAAQAQTSNTVYGLLDAGLVAERGCVNGGTCTATKLSGGVASGSRLGVTGREALAGDVAAVYTLEAGVLNDTGQSDQNGTLFGRQAYVGLDGRLGALTLGRQYNPQYLTLTDVADPFKGGMAGSASNLIGFTSKRYDNTVKYSTPLLRGLSASALYSFGESPYSSDINRAYGATLGYANSVVNLSVAHQRKNNIIQAGATMPIDTSARNTLVAANVNLGPAIAFAAFGVNKGLGSSPWDPSNPYGSLALSMSSTDSRDMLAGISVPVGAANFMASYIRKDDRDLANRDARQIAIGMTYSFSKRTDFYASYAKIRNTNGAPYTVGNASDAGRGNSAINLGLRYGF
ncbi:porin [Janthinobacterium agaricidamnosum]|uniref:Gram-negative porin family protein n=1 Tax=Janthinobacterium agaricidamnosum NBRC 102515 = DSM 9628 TaxID=1349767 RepID=W0V9U5_9BURK|nr:porin [Janthinobacterium agaricidamnosum]CDG84375.1 gram-negative porin family protein [Janthinobacterium agaricidamnosum NBRC 102515 = DSM 9628]